MDVFCSCLREDQPLIKVVVVGDGAVGKTCLLISFTENVFPKKYVPTIFNNSMKEVTLKSENGEPGTKVSLDLWDTAGQEEFDRIRYLSYRDTHVFFFCYSCVDPDSFQNIKSRWMPEIQYHLKITKPTKVLVGLKSDLRKDEKTLENLRLTGKSPVSKEEVEKYAKENNMAHMEVSALKKTNVDEVFNLAVNKFLGGRGEEIPSGGACCEIL